jgi:hypothetical protein
MKLALALFLASILSSCAYIETFTGPSKPPDSQPTEAAPSEGSKPAAQEATSHSVTYGFEDVPTPRELAYVPKDSYVFAAGETKSGFLVLRGRVEISSIVRFFELALPRNEWIKKGSLQSGRSILFFEKPDKACIVNVYDRNFLTYVEIYIIPFTEKE